MRLEPLARQSDWVSQAAIMCGIAPLPLLLFSMLPLVGCLSSPLLLACVPAAIGFGIAGIIRTHSQPEPNYVQPVTGLLLGLIWVVVLVAGALFLSRGLPEKFRIPSAAQLGGAPSK